MGYHDAMKHGETNVGLGMVASKEERSREDWHSLLIERDRLASINRELVEALEGFVSLVDATNAMGEKSKADGNLMTKARAVLAKVKS